MHARRLAVEIALALARLLRRLQLVPVPIIGRDQPRRLMSKGIVIIARAGRSDTGDAYEQYCYDTTASHGCSIAADTHIRAWASTGKESRSNK